MKKKILAGLATVSLMLGTAQMSSAYLTTDILEDIALDGTAITSRVIGDVTVSISTSKGIYLGARTYFDNSPAAFHGADDVDNVPLNPSNVSGTRFISTSAFGVAKYPFDSVAPIIFDFSIPVLGFGLTTLDLLENGESSNTYVKLEALNSNGQIVASQTRTGPKGSSGLDLDWYVFSSHPEITQVLLSSNMGNGYSGYGIDDLVIDTAPVPVPATMLLLGSGVVGLAVTRLRRKKK